MTTITARGPVMAADTQESDSEHGVFTKCDKIFRKQVTRMPGGRKRYDCLIGTAGESFSGMVFVDWFPGIHHLIAPAEKLVLPKSLEEFDADFLTLILDHTGIYMCDKWLRPIKVKEKFAAIGSGAKLALAAMEMGASAKKAVEIACRYDLYSRLPVVQERLR